MGRKKNTDAIPHEAIRRLSLYLRDLKRLSQEKIRIVSSEEITRFLSISPAQFRKDLSYFGPFGKRGVGYDVEKLTGEIEKILGTEKLLAMALVGAGKLGAALLGYAGFLEFNLKIALAFDNDASKVGRVIHGVRIQSTGDMARLIRQRKIRMALLAVPAPNAQKTGHELARSGIRAILNFAPVNLNLPQEVHVTNVDMASEMGSLVYRLHPRPVSSKKR